MNRCSRLIVASLFGLTLVAGLPGCAFAVDGDGRLEPLSPAPWYANGNGGATSGQVWPGLPDVPPSSGVEK